MPRQTNTVMSCNNTSSVYQVRTPPMVYPLLCTHCLYIITINLLGKSPVIQGIMNCEALDSSNLIRLIGVFIGLRGIRILRHLSTLSQRNIYM